MIDLAISIARRNLGRDGRSYSLAAVGVRGRDGVVVSAINGWPRYPDRTSHAEARVLRKMGKGGIVYVARVKRDGSVGCAKPCPACSKMLRDAGVEVRYT